jgi:hypothetical protein
MRLVDLPDPLLRNVNLALDTINICIQHTQHLILHNQFFVDHDTHLLHSGDCFADLKHILLLLSHNTLLQL